MRRNTVKKSTRTAELIQKLTQSPEDVTALEPGSDDPARGWDARTPALGSAEAAVGSNLSSPFMSVIFNEFKKKMDSLNTMTATLEMIGISAAIVAPDGTIRVANGLFQRDFHTTFLPSPQKVRLPDASQNRKFMQDLLNISKGIRNAASLFLSEGDDHSLKSLHLMAIKSLQDETLLGDSVMLILSHKGTMALDPDILKALYDLTPAEIRVSGLLSAGKSAYEIAMTNGTSIHTVRNQIKSILSKTGMSSQASLIALLNMHVNKRFDF